jgi:transcriptional regulator with XRE-family HTH domain
MNISIRNARQDKGMSLQQFADLMGIDKLEAISVEADDVSGILDRETYERAQAVIADTTVEEVEPLDIEDGPVNAVLWNLGIAGRLENENVKRELLNRINAGQL